MVRSRLKGWRLLDVGRGAFFATSIIVLSGCGAGDFIGRKFKQEFWSNGQLAQSVVVEITDADSGGATVSVTTTGSGTSATLNAGGGSSGASTPGNPQSMWVAEGTETGSLHIEGLFPHDKRLELYEDFS